MQNPELSKEWEILQNQFDSYEKFSLVIKIASVITIVLILLFKNENCLMVIFPFLFWGIDAIWKTFQDRIGQRLFVIEKAIFEKSDVKPFQFNSEWEKGRSGVVGLILEYVKMALKPTVLFPHIILTASLFYEVLAKI